MHADGKIGERLKHLRILKGLSQREVANKVRVTQAIIQKIEDGKVKHPKCLNDLAKLLDTTPEHLIGGVGISRTDHRETFNKIPVLEWDEAAKWCEPEKNDISSEGKKFILNPIESENKNHFALIMNRTINQSVFPEGSMVILEPVYSENDISKGDYGLFYNTEEEISFMRQVVIDTKKYLKPLSAGLPWEKMTKNFRGLAKVVFFIGILNEAYNI